MHRTDRAASAPGFRRLGIDAAIYAAGSLVSKIAGLLLLPILTRALSQAEYGELDVVWAFASGLTGILLLGLDVAAARLFFDDETPSARRNVVGSWALLTVIAALAAGFAVPLLSPIIGPALAEPSSPDPTIVLGGVVSANITFAFVLLTLRVLQRPIRYALVSLLGVGVYGASVIILSFQSAATPTSVLAAWGLSLIIGTLVGLIWICSAIGRPTRVATASLLRLGLPLAPVAAVTLMAEFAHRAILLAAAGAEQVAVLTVSIRFASVLGLIIAGFHLAWLPRALNMGSSSLAWHRIAVDGRRFLVLCCGIAILGSLIAPAIIPMIAGSDYARSVAPFGTVLVAALGTATQLVVSLPSILRKRPADVTIATLVGAGTATVFNLLMAPRLGAVGTASAMAVGAWSGAGVAAALAYRGGTLRLRWQVTASTLAATSLSIIGLSDGSITIGDIALLLVAALMATLGLRRELPPMELNLPARE